MLLSATRAWRPVAYARMNLVSTAATVLGKQKQQTSFALAPSQKFASSIRVNETRVVLCSGRHAMSRVLVDVNQQPKNNYSESYRSLWP